MGGSRIVWNIFLPCFIYKLFESLEVIAFIGEFPVSLKDLLSFDLAPKGKSIENFKALFYEVMLHV